MQLYERLYNYIAEYQSLIYDVYSKHSIAYLVTYYNLDTENTVWDNTDLMGGSYEIIGDLSGMRWNKYLLLPVFFIEEVTTIFDASEIGVTKENETHIVIPSTYNIQPYPNDMLKFEQSYLRTSNDVYPLFVVTGMEKSVNVDRTFWKLKIEIKQSKTITQLDEQVSRTFAFFEYTKKIYDLPTAVFLTKLLYKSSTLCGLLKERFDQNSGFYLI